MALSGYRFIQGFTGDLRNSIEKRDEAERDRKKAEFLESLRRDTYKWQKEIDSLYARRDVDKNQTQFDYTKGVKVLRNSEGDVLREIPLTQSEISSYQMERRGLEAKTKAAETDASFAERKALSDLARDAAAIRASDASAANAGTSAAYTRAQMKALEGQGKGGSSIDDRANELAERQKVIVEDLVKSGVPAELVQKLAVESVVQSAARGGRVSPETIFISGAGGLRQRARGTGNAGVQPIWAKPLKDEGF